jgi:hypothetical protein
MKLNERGSAMIMVAVCLLAIIAIAGVAIDSAVMVTTRTQLQNAADAAALAGASGLLEGDQDTAIARAISFASFNGAMLDSGAAPVVITEDDVTFPEDDIVRVVTHRTQATGDGVRVFFRKVVDPVLGNRADVTAVAAAQAFDICSSRCLKPWCIPDRWDDANGNGEYDVGEAYDPYGTGYTAPDDVGLQVTLKPGDPHDTMVSSNFYAVCFPPIDSDQGDPLTGADWYRQWIAECTPYLIEVGDRLAVQPGNMSGPTRQGVQDIIAQDPGATWDSATQTVVGSAFGRSPRIVLVPMLDPRLAPNPGRQEVTVTKIGAFFLEGTGPQGTVIGRYMTAATTGAPCEGGLGEGLVKGIALIE